MYRSLIFLLPLFLSFSCAKEVKPGFSSPSQSPPPKVDSVFASLSDLINDSPDYSTAEDFLEHNTWRCTKNETYALLEPADTFYHEIGDTGESWEFDFIPSNWPLDTLPQGDLSISMRYSNGGYSYTSQFKMGKGYLLLSLNSRNEYWPISRVTRYEGEIFSFQISHSRSVNDSTTRVEVRQLQSVKN